MFGPDRSRALRDNVSEMFTLPCSSIWNHSPHCNQLHWFTIWALLAVFNTPSALLPPLELVTCLILHFSSVAFLISFQSGREERLASGQYGNTVLKKRTGTIETYFSSGLSRFVPSVFVTEYSQVDLKGGEEKRPSCAFFAVCARVWVCVCARVNLRAR